MTETAPPFEPLHANVVADIQAACGLLNLFPEDFAWPLEASLLEYLRRWSEEYSKHLGYSAPTTRWLTDEGQLEGARLLARFRDLEEHGNNLTLAVIAALRSEPRRQMDSAGQQAALWLMQNQLPRSTPASDDKAISRFVEGDISSSEAWRQLQDETETSYRAPTPPTNQMRFRCTTSETDDQGSPMQLCWTGTLEFDPAEIESLGGDLTKYTGPCPRCGDAVRPYLEGFTSNTEPVAVDRVASSDPSNPSPSADDDEGPLDSHGKLRPVRPVMIRQDDPDYNWPFDMLRKALQDDPDYAWSWHCNIAMAFYDVGGNHGLANKAATLFMQRTFGVTTEEPGKKP